MKKKLVKEFKSYLNDKNSFWKIISGLITFFSISFAHYAGFFMQVPVELVSVFRTAFLIPTTTSFIFYSTLSSVISLIVLFILYSCVFCVLLLVNRITLFFINKNLKNILWFVRVYNRAVDGESFITFCFRILAFIMFMFMVYMNASLTTKGWFFLIALIFVIFLSILIRTKYLLVFNHKMFLYKVSNYPRFRVRFFSVSLFCLASLLIICSFFIGVMRMNYLLDQKSVLVNRGCFVGSGKILANDGDRLLLAETKEGDDKIFRFVFFDNNQVVSLGDQSISPIKACD